MSQKPENTAQKQENEIIERLDLINYNMNDLKQMTRLDHAVNKCENSVALQGGRISVVETKQDHQDEKIGKIEKTTYKMFDKIDELNDNVLKGQSEIAIENVKIKNDFLDYQEKTNKKILKNIYWAFAFSLLIAGSIGLLYRLFFGEIKQIAVREQVTSDKLIEVLKVEIKNMYRDTTSHQH